MINKIIKIIVIFIFLIFLSGCVDNSQSNIVVIDDKGTFYSIQEAIYSADENDTIKVYKGSYYESLIINKTINLIGENSKNTFIICNDTDESTSAIIRIESDNCIVEGFTIDGNICDKEIPGIRLFYSNNNKISNNSIINNKHGIYLYESSKNKIFLNNIINNSETGIFVSKDSNSNIYDNNNINFNEKGVWLTYVSNNIISRNTINNNNDYGVYISLESDYNTVSSNNISYNLEGINIKGGQHNKVFDNILIGNDEGINIIVCCGIKVDTNDVYNNEIIN